jgi:predicted phage-related endonuclease
MTSSFQPPVVIDDLADQLQTSRLAKAEIQKLKAEIETWESVKEAADEAVKNRLGDNEVGTVGGRTAVVWKHHVKTRVDVKRLRAEIPPEVIDPYLITTTERRFEIKE